MMKILRELFTNFGVAENLTSDDWSQFRAHDTQEFLTRWGIKQGLVQIIIPTQISGLSLL